MSSPRQYGSNASAAVGTNLTNFTLLSATTIRPALYDLVVGCAATPGDQATKYTLQRVTAAGTAGSNPTPSALDPADPASLATVGAGVFSGEPTYTATVQLLLFDLNQRATYRWVAAPGSEVVCPATANAGVGLRSVASTGSYTGEGAFLYRE